jgi:hypothetical protein
MCPQEQKNNCGTLCAISFILQETEMRKHRIFLLSKTKGRNNHAGRSSKSLVSHIMLPLVQFILLCLLCFQNILKVKPFTEEESEVRYQFWMKFVIVAVCRF